MTDSDFGIFLEIIGFLFLLYVNSDVGKSNNPKSDKLSKSVGQFMAISMIEVGLIAQFSMS